MIYYYGIAYFHNGEANISMPFDSYDEMMDAMKKAVAKHPEKIKATSYITRNGDGGKLTTMDILGHPKSRDLMQDKKFLASL